MSIFAWILNNPDAQSAANTLRASAETVQRCLPEAAGASNNVLTNTALRSAAAGAARGAIARGAAAATPLPLAARYSECVAASVMRPLPLPQGTLPAVSAQQQPTFSLERDGIEPVQITHGSGMTPGEWLTLPLDLTLYAAQKGYQAIRSRF